MSDPVFFRQSPDTFRILGLKLKPLSIGHVHLLEAIQSPFLYGNLPGIDDLVAAVVICSRSWKRNQFYMEHPRLSLWFQWLWFKRVGTFSFLSKVGLFREYIGEAFERPLYRMDEKLGDNGAPLALTVQMYLSSHNVPAHWDRPWTEAMRDYLLLKAIKGDIAFMERASVERAQSDAQWAAELIRSGKLKIPKAG